MKLKIEFLSTELTGHEAVFIYGFGIAGRWLAAQLGTKVKGFIDTDEKKRGREFCGIRVFSISEARELLFDDAVIINTVIDIQDVLDTIEQLPHARALALGLYLEHGTSKRVCGIEESTEFLEYSLDAVEKCHKGFYDQNSLFLRSVDVVITERCTLKCKDCSNLMQYYPRPQNVPKEEVLHDFNTLIKNVDHVYEVRLIGGEPFMNKEIYNIIAELVESKKISRLVIYSNAMIQFQEDKIDVLKHPKVVLSLTDYRDLAKSTHRNVARLKKESIPYRIHPPENWTDSGIIMDFNRTNQENEHIFEKCCGKNLLTLSKNRLYRCPFSANADRLNAIPPNTANYITADSSPKDILMFTRKIKSLPACNYCKGRSFDAPQITPAVQTKNPLTYKRFPLIPAV